jgi:hypothetical protein
MGLADAEAEHALALGLRNAQVIELFERYCANVRVEVMSGTGMLEAATGLPIGHRAFRCAYAPGGVQYGADLEEVAVEFYEEHCRGCGDRVRSSLLGDSIATVADARHAALDARAALETAEKAERQRQREDRAARRARRRVGEPYQTVRQLECVDRLDAAEGSPDAADVEELVRTAALGPEIVSAATAGELVDLARDAQVPWAVREAAQAVLVPLTSAGRVPAETAAEIALASLAEGSGTQAGRLLVTAADAVQAESITGNVARSAVELAGHTGDPVALAMSRFSSRAVAADPAPLLLCADRNADVVLQAVERMLASASQEPPTALCRDTLVGPDGQPLGSVPESTSFPGAADRSRSIAAVACLPLIEEMPAMAARLVEALARSLEFPDQDRYDAPPSRMAGMTLGQGLLRRYDEVAPAVLAVAPRVSAEARKSLFAAISSALHSAGGRQLSDPASLPRLVQLAVDRLQGDWGEEVSTEAALTLRDQARFHPERLDGHADGFVGALVMETTRPAGSVSGLVVPGVDPLSGIEELARRQRRATRISCLEQAIGYLVEAGADDATGALLSLLDTDDDGSADAVSVRASATRLLGKIGSRAARLPAVVPRLYTGLLHAQDKVRRAAVQSWADLAGQPQPLPSTLLDLLPALLADAHVAVSTLQLIDRLEIPPERRPELLELVSGLSRAAHRAVLNNPEQTIASCVNALRSLASDLPDHDAEEPVALALVISDRLSSHDLRDLLLSWWPPRLANSGLFAVRALSVLAAPEFADYFNERDYRVQAALLACPYGTSLQPLDSFMPTTDLHLPDRPWPALEMIEVLQRAGRWDDAAEIARHIHAAIPGTQEHQARADLTAIIAELAAGETLLSTGTVPAIPATPAQSGRALDDILSRYTAAADARRALHEVGSYRPTQDLAALADRLEETAEAIQPAQSPAPVLPTEAAWTAWAGALRCLVHLTRWDAAVQDASESADRHLLAGRRRAEIALEGMPVDHASDPLLHSVGALNYQIALIQQPGDVAGLARGLAAIPLPVRVIEERSRHYRSPVPSGEDEQKLVPAVGICRLDGALVTNAHVLRPDEVHDLGLELRLTEWPEHATAIEVTFLSVLSPSQARLPSFTFTRTSPDDDGVYRLSATGSLSVSFTLPAGAPPQAFPVAARFTGPGLDEVLPVAGHNELRLRPFDATTDALTKRPQLDERIVAMYSVLHGKDLNADDVQAFCRLYTAIVDKAVAMQYEGTYMNKGTGVTERAFHNDLFGRLLSDPALEGRVKRGTRAAGGFLDIIHDRINAELKVTKKTSVTVKTSHKYLGQPADYAADTGSQLSILVVLDMTPKQTPPGVLENYLGLMRPAIDGFDDPQFPSGDPRFPSIVGVVIIKANLRVPSTYSRGAGGPEAYAKPL